jgi:hypothetical protein
MNFVTSEVPLSKVLADHIEILISILIGVTLVSMNLFGAAPSVTATPDEAVAERRRDLRRQRRFRWGAVVLVIAMIRLAFAGGSSTLNSSGGYSVTFPGTVREETTLQDVGSRSVPLYRAWYQTPEVTYEAAYFDRPPNLPIRAENLVQSLASGWGNPTQRNWIDVDGFTGEEVTFATSANRTATLRIFVGTQRVCYLLQIVPASDVGKPEIARFFESFHFKKQ